MAAAASNGSSSSSSSSSEQRQQQPQHPPRPPVRGLFPSCSYPHNTNQYSQSAAAVLTPVLCPTFPTSSTHPSRFYGKVFPAAGNKDVAVLDICSSWVSHYPPGYTAGKVTGGACLHG
jgi:hypothetical protein